MATWRYDGGMVPGDSDAPIQVMDSFLVTDGVVNGLDLHAARFADSCGRLHGLEVPEELYASVATLVPREGRWFPRVECRAGQFYLRVRPAPPRRGTTVLWIPPTVDPRTRPTHKGPDSEVLARLRRQAQARGADDALLHDGVHALEGANSALLVRVGGELVQSNGDVLPSTSVRLLGQSVVRAPLPLATIRRYPAYTLSALHGMTPVSGWVTTMGGHD